MLIWLFHCAFIIFILRYQWHRFQKRKAKLRLTVEVRLPKFDRHRIWQKFLFFSLLGNSQSEQLPINIT